MSVDRKILIVGAGPAGLSCAYKLSCHNRPCLLIEKEAVGGGICKTIGYKGFRFDVGGHRFFTESETVQNLWKSFLGSDFLRRKRCSRIYFDGKLLSYPINIFDVFSQMGGGKSLSIFYDYLKAQAFLGSRQDTNFKDWVVKRFGVKLYDMFFKDYTEKIWGMPCEDISSDWAQQRIKGLSLAAIVKNAFVNKQTKIKTLIDEFWYPKYGCGQVYDKILEYVLGKGSSILCNSMPQEIEISNNRVRSVSVVNDRGEIIRFNIDYLVSSMPFANIFSLLKPLPPSYVLDAAAKLRYRSFLEVCLIVKGRSESPDQWIYIQDPKISAGRLQIYKNWSPYMRPDDSSCINIGVEYFCSSGDDLWMREDKDIIKLAETQLPKLKIFENLEVVDGFIVRVPYAYPVYAGSYKQDIAVLKDYIEKIENLQVIGRCGMHRYNNMDHSMLTGIRAAANIIKANKEHDLWGVNEEKKYLEARS